MITDDDYKSYCLFVSLSFKVQLSINEVPNSSHVAHHGDDQR